MIAIQRAPVLVAALGIAAATALAGPRDASADIIRLKNGEEVRGIVVDQNEEWFQVEVGPGGTVKIPSTEVILPIIKESERLYYLSEGEKQLAAGNAERAKELFTKAREAGDDRAVERLARVARVVGDRALGRGDLEAAEKAYREAFELGRSDPRVQAFLDAIRAQGVNLRPAEDRAREALDQRRYAHALAAFRHVAFASPPRRAELAKSVAQACAGAGLATEKAGLPTWAEALLRGAIENDRLFAGELAEPLGRARARIALDRLLADDPVGAETALREALREQPDSSILRFALGVSLEAVGDRVAAAAEYRTLILARGESVTTDMSLAVLREASERLAGSLPTKAALLADRGRLERVRASLPKVGTRGRFTVHAADDAAGSAALGACDSAARALSWLGEAAAKAPVEVYVLKGAEPFAEATGFAAARGAVLVSGPDRVEGRRVHRIYTYGETPLLLEAFLPQAVARALLEAACEGAPGVATGPVPPWLAQGVAVYATGSQALRDVYLARYRSGLVVGEWIDARELVRFSSFPSDGVLYFESASYAAARLLFARGGNTAVLELARRLAQGGKLDETSLAPFALEDLTALAEELASETFR